MWNLGWFEFLKLILEKPRYFSMALSIVTFLILVFPFLLPTKVKPFFDKTIQLRERFFSAIIVIFLISGTVQLTYYLAVHFEYEKKIERLEQLTPEEKKVLKSFISKKKINGCWDQYRFDGALKALERDNVIYLIYEEPKWPWTRCYNIERWAYSYLQENPRLLD